MTVQPTRDQLRALADEATPGPWRIGEAFTEPACWVAHLSDNGWDDHTTVTSQDTTSRDDQEVRDATFIAAARTAVPQLLDALTRAEARADIRGRAVAMYRERARKAEARVKAVEDVLDQAEALYVGEIKAEHRAVHIHDIRRVLEG